MGEPDWRDYLKRVVAVEGAIADAAWSSLQHFDGIDGCTAGELKKLCGRIESGAKLLAEQRLAREKSLG